MTASTSTRSVAASLRHGRAPRGTAAVLYTCSHRTVDHTVTSPLRIAKPLTWTLVALLTTLLAYIAFRGYLTPELLIGFANSFTC